MDMKKNFPSFLVFMYILVFIWSSIHPIDRSVWRVEALTSLIPIILFSILFLFKIKFSNITYALCFIFPTMHIIGAHYTFAAVPFDWFNNIIHSDRNMYDRVAHMSVGFYSFAIIELLLIYKVVNKKWFAYLFALCFIMALAMGYELFEWWYAVSVNPTAGIEVLGSQGDIWDAQKDMLMDTMGAIIGIVIFVLSSGIKINKEQN